MPDVAIECRDLAKAFGKSSPALQGVSFTVARASVCALLGHNGAGKTTTINILSTLVRPTAGSATVAGFDVERESADVRSSIGVTGQAAALDEFLSGRENLMLFAQLRGLRHRHARQRADELIDRFDMGHAADRRVSTYSGGMRRRIDIAVALVVPPRVLFLDEPTTGLDPRSRRDVWDLVSALRHQDVTVLLTTQYLEEADVLSDSIIVLNSGRVVASGTADDLKCRVGVSYCQVTPADPMNLTEIATALADFAAFGTGCDTLIDHQAAAVSVPAPDGVATFGEVFRRLDGLGIELADISLRKPSLDEAFLSLTSPPVTV
ncbi:ATP-binding cassette domain-containing protein [Mycolicibacterium moriokaense]|uniref:ABC-2 type transport system ATP-binding protein n=1 Tax=Mycolicibacterium moriokaense TaxID=39691 RepID=A0A318HKG5_9MYCO|nr:ATP-binding cassette domain-containing protein [Mycolicibacterium moriokaense]PXX11314.1 ABC-2 type transport system ATP-binding protein [Mycolicibacterium moriokaense]